MKIITSRANQEIKDVASLHFAKFRKQKQQFIAQGIRACSALIESGHVPIALYVTEEMIPVALKLVAPDAITRVTSEIIQKIKTDITPSGMVGVFSIPSQPHADMLSAGIVLAQIADPGNMGTLIRSAAAMKAQSVVIIEGADPWSPKVVQASAGTIGSVNLFIWSWLQLVENKKNLTLCGLVVSGGDTLESIRLDNKIKPLLIVGSEAHGIPIDWLGQCDKKITLAMPGGTESFNAAVAGSIALYMVFHS